jgi:hypothetical protein
MHETHTEITADGSKHAPTRPAVGALTVRTERRASPRGYFPSGSRVRVVNSRWTWTSSGSGDGQVIRRAHQRRLSVGQILLGGGEDGP